EGSLWFGTEKGLSKQSGETWKTFTIENGLAENGVFSLLEDREGNIWCGTEQGVSRFDGKNWMTFTTEDGLAHNHILAICEDTEGNLWFGTQGGGVSRFDGKNWMTITTEDGLAHNHILTIFEDKEGNLWFGAKRGGVSKLGGLAFLSYTEKDGLANNMVQTILEDNKGNLWFGTWGGGVSRFDGKHWMTFTKEDGLAGNSVLSILEDKHGTIWLGTDLGGITKFDGREWQTIAKEERPRKNRISSIIEDSEGDLWFGTYRGASRFDGKNWRTFTTEDGLAHNGVFSIFEDSDRNLWFGTKEGLSKFDRKNWRTFTTKDGLVHNYVISIFEDTEGDLWVGTNGGVSKFDGSSFLNYTSKNGLSDNTCYFIIQSDNYLYFGTNKGVNRFDGKSFKLYTSQDGLAANEMNREACLKDSQGNLWFGTIAGATRFNPKLDRPNLVPPPVYISRVSLLDKDFPISDGSELKHSENYLRFDFVGICFSAPEALIYNYKLEGLDKDWRISTLRTIHYTNLSSGSYTFKVKAMNKDGVWSAKGAEFKFAITPPFWNRWWFRIFSLLVLAGISSVILKEWHKRKLLSELKDKNIELENSLGHERLISRIASRFNSADSFQDVMDELLEVIGKYIGVDSVCLYKLDLQENKVMRLSKWTSLSCSPAVEDLCGEDSMISGHSRFAEFCERVISGEKIISSDLFDLNADERNYLKSLNIGAIFILPVRLVDSMMGCISFCQNHEYLWKPEEYKLFHTIADMISNAWQRYAHFQARLEAEEKRTEAIHIAESASRLASIGEMAAGITHEINQPLTTINFSVDMLLYWDKNNRGLLPGIFRDRLLKISASVERMDKIIQHMRSFWASPGRIEKETTDLNQVVKNALSLLNRQLHSHGIEPEIALSKEALPTRGNTIHLEQVVINLTLNAMYSLDEINSVEKKIKVSTWLEDNSVCLEIQDNGTGLPEEVGDRIFDPFYTTKRPGEGTGLGLAIVKRFVDKYNGSITAWNNQSGGATFTVRFPVAQALE
ncbi:MAG TPA: two-component regulator propeller domain-containing protein, partial [archaeon]|nr:two-component regulator propeller domain-containing protein [archaeon]